MHGQEFRRMTRKGAQIVCGDPLVVRTDDPIYESDGEVKPFGVFQDMRKSLCCGIPTLLSGRGGVDPLTYKIDAFVGKSEIGHIEAKISLRRGSR